MLFDRLDTELKSLTLPSPSIIALSFTLSLITHVTCPCGASHDSPSSTLVLPLDLPPSARNFFGRRAAAAPSGVLTRCSLSDCFDYSLLSTHECAQCHTARAEVRVRVTQWPRVLALSVQRGVWGARGAQKVQTHVDAPLTLDVTPWSEPSPFSRPPLYSLYGIITHEGSRLSSGHYTAFCKQSDGEWVHLNDARVDVVEEREVSAAQPYMLFYVKTGRKAP